MRGNCMAARNHDRETTMNALDLWDIHTGKRFPFDSRSPRIDNGKGRPSPELHVSPASAPDPWPKVLGISVLLARLPSPIRGPAPSRTPSLCPAHLSRRPHYRSSLAAI